MPCTPPRYICSNLGFTLAELLVALAVIGVIATFTIPKVLQNQQNNQSKAVVKETLAAVSEAYQIYKTQNPAVPTTMTFGDLTPYLNYVAMVNSEAAYPASANFMDHLASIAPSPQPCSSMLGAGQPPECIKLHNGAMIRFYRTQTMCGTSTTHALQFNIDPNGQYDGQINGPGTSIRGYLYYTGKVVTHRDIYSPSSINCVDGFPAGSYDPGYFNWN